MTLLNFRSSKALLKRFIIGMGLFFGTKFVWSGQIPYVATVDIFAHYNLNNPPSAAPYTGFVGQYEAKSLNLDFGDYTSLTSFAAVVTFSEYFPANGATYFQSLVNSSNGYTANIYNKSWGSGNVGPFSLGGEDDEFPEQPGVNVFQVDFIAGISIPDGDNGLVGGPPYILDIGAPDIDGNNQPPGLPPPVLLPVPDVGNTLVQVVLGLLVLVMLNSTTRHLSTPRKVHT